jgi:hypothetical protein
VSTEPTVQELLSPLTSATDDLASRRSHVDKGAIVSRMVEVSLAPRPRFGSRARIAAALALAATFALATWGGAAWWKRSGTIRSAGIEVVALRGNVLATPGGKSRGLSVGEPTTMGPEDIIETSEGSGARIKAGGGLEIDLLENTKVSLDELDAVGVSPALRLDRGRVRCVIAHQPGRTFSVVTAAARVIDVGTIFSVSVDNGEGGPRTFVHVEEGEVLVQFAGGESRITAAQTWTSATESSKTAAVAQPPSVPAAEPSSAPGRRRDLVKRRYQTLDAETELLRSGLAREQKGDLRGAVTAFETLVTRYPESQLASDARAALSRVKGRLESSK